MWKPTQPETPASNTPPEPVRPAPTSSSVESASRAAASNPGEQATISKGLFINGEIEGSVNLNGNRVTVGRNGHVAASITAREVVVLGKVRGNVTATDRVDIRAEGALTG